MGPAEVLAVLDAIRAVGCRSWLEGGWCVDALVGYQTRAHRDVDEDFDATYEEVVLQVLTDDGFSIETGWRPNRVELVAAGRDGWTCIPSSSMTTPTRGSRPQRWVARVPRSWFTHGTLGDKNVPCVSEEAQHLFHSGYELRPVDRHDLDELNRLTL